MKKEAELNVYLMPRPGLVSQWTSLLGDKYANALPFDWQITESPEEAQVIVWDGMVNVKLTQCEESVLSWIKGGKILLLQREAYTLFKDHSYMTEVELDGMNWIELPGGNVLPEDLLQSLERCHEKLNHV